MKPAGFLFLGALIVIAPHIGERQAINWTLALFGCALIAWCLE